MTHPLLERLGQLRRQTRWLLVIYALAWVVGAIVLVATLLGLADYLTRFEDRGLRWLAWFSLLGVTGWVIVRYWRRPLRARLDDLFLAQQVENRFPLFRDTISSAVEFLHQDEDDEQAGSALLRRTVVQQATSAVERLDFRQALDRRPVRLALIACGWTLFAAALLVCLDRTSTTIALSRLIAPWSDVGWPKQNHLALRDLQSRVPLGQSFEIEVIDAAGAELPPQATIQFRFGDGMSPESTRSELMRRRDDHFETTMERVERPFAFRVSGGDDDSMPWQRVEVVEPPAVAELDVKLHYPEYTAWPATLAEPHIRALVGTRVSLSGKSTKPLKSVVISLDGNDAAPAATFVATVGEDRVSFHLSAEGEQALIVKTSGSYRIDLEDSEGFHGWREMRYDLRAIEDRAPTVALEQPAADGFVTPEAIVPVRVLAKDDLALKSIELGILRSDESDKGTTNTTIWQGPEQAEPPVLDERHTGPIHPPGESRVVEHQLDLATLKLKPGAQLTLHATAHDYRPVSTQSHVRRLTVVAPTELQERLAERQAVLLGELSRALKLQRDARLQVGNVEIQLNQVESVSKADVDRLQQSELLQRQVERTLTSKTDGLPAQIAGLMADLRNNRLESGDTPEQMQRLADELARLAEQALPGAARELVTAIKDAQSRLGDGDKRASPKIAKEAPTRQSIATAGKHQDEVIESLEQLVSDLSQWDSYRRFHRELGQLRKDQESLRNETEQVGKSTLAKPLDKLSPQEAADLKKLAIRQADLARQFEKSQQRMAEMAGSLREHDPAAADTLKDALHHAQQQAISGQLREAGRNVEQNQLGPAGAQQQQAARDLEQMLDILSQRRESELGRLVKKLREAEQQLGDLRQKQEGLREKLTEAEKLSDPEQKKRELEKLSREQRELQQQAERFARQLQRLQADQASRSAARGSGKMSQAGEQAGQGDAKQAGEQAEQALKDLDDAQQQLAQRRQKAEHDLAAEQAAQIQQLVQELVQRQEKLLAETRHYEQVKQAAQDRLTRAQAQSVQDLGRHQLAPTDETAGLSERMTSEVIKFALDGVAQDMRAASEKLATIDVSPVTQRLQQHALNRARRLLEAFKEDAPPKKPGEQKESQPQGQGQQQSGGAKSPSIAEIKLVKALQENLNDRTGELQEEVTRQKGLTPELSREAAQLAREQGRLADMLIKLTTPDEPKPKEQPLGDLLEGDAKRPGTLPKTPPNQPQTKPADR